MNDLDDWLNSLNDEEPSTPQNPDDTVVFCLPNEDISVPIVHEQPEIESTPDTQESESSEPTALSEQDFDDILGDFGFTPPENAEAEEISERESTEGEVVENTEERDLDAEEDAAWNELIESGGISPVEPEHIETQAVPAARPVIPLNSPTLVLDESTSRFSGAEWYNIIQQQSIIVAGIGGIGSNLCFQLSRMHPRSIFMYDDDRVETVNMAGQLYSRDDMGKTKVDAISKMMERYTNMRNIFAINERFTSGTEAGNIMMCGFDNMEARKTFFNSWHKLIKRSDVDKKTCLFLDGRLSIDTLQIFCLTGDDTANIERYENEFLFSDANADPTVCSLKQTTYLACMIGSLMTNLFTNWAANLLDPLIPYDLPFFTEYDAQNMIFKTIK